MPIEDIQVLGSDVPAPPTYSAPTGASLEAYLESAKGHQAATGGLFDAHFDVTDAFKRIAPGVRSPYESSLLVGPSLQPRPLPQMHIDFAPLFGANQSALRSKTFVVFGWEF